jgi:hypothetical protein
MLLLLMTVLAAANVQAQDTEEKQASQETMNTYVLVVGGVNRDPEEQQAKDKAVIKLRNFFLKKAKVDPARLRVLVDENSFARRDGGVSNVENLKKAFTELAAAVKPADRFIFYYVGQANIVAGKLRLNLPGNDITGEQLAKYLGQIKAAQTLLVLDCPGAGLAIKALKGPQRIIICAARSDQPYSTRFSEYFVPALADSASDTDSDGKISLCEAFTLASKQLDDLYRKQDLLKTETPLLEDDGDGIPSQHPWRYKETQKDGLAASTFFFVTE